MARRRSGFSSRKRAKLEPCGVGANALDHGANAVRTLWRQMLLEAEGAKGAARINFKDLFRRTVGKKSDCDRNKPLHKVGVAVAAIVQGRSALGVRCRLAIQPHLTYAATDLVGGVVGGRVQRLKRMAELDDIAIPILPFVKGGEIVAYGVDRRQKNPVTFARP